mgnify:CR=1 FL=1
MRAGWAAGRSFLWWMASPRLFGSGREVVVGVWGDWRKWGLMRAGGLSGFPGVDEPSDALDGWEERLSFLWSEGEG